MSIFEESKKEIPEKSPFMYLKGYTPEEIRQSAKKSIIDQHEQMEQAKREKEEENDIPTV